MIKTLKLSKFEDTPEVLLDKEHNNFVISGRSLPENSYEFYRPIIFWIDEYILEPNPITNFII